MIKVILKNNVSRKEVITTPDATPKQVLEENGVAYGGAAVNLDGDFLSFEELGETFAAAGVQDGETISLTCIVKADGAY